MIVYEWGGGQVTTYLVYSTEPEFQQILELSTRADLYKSVALTQLELYEESDIEGLENCPPPSWPYDSVVYTFFPDRAERQVVHPGEVPDCAKQ